MDERKLNFNAPLLSVRRISTKPKSSYEPEKKKNVILQTSHPNRQKPLPVSKSDQSFEHLTEPASVPFIWEQIPGRPKDDNRSRTLEETWMEQAGLDVEGEEDVYSDALDTLSLTDSFSMKFSISGVSGFDNHVLNQSEIFSKDPQTRDFMMRRFLPAAKAMTLVQPQYSSPKKQTKETKKVVSVEKRLSVNRHESTVIPNHHGNVNDHEESHEDEEVDDDEGDDNDYDHDNGVYSNLAKKGCRFLPRLCIKTSLCILNPVPSLKGKIPHSSISSKIHNLGQPRKTLYHKSQSKTINKIVTDSVSKQNPGFGIQSPRICSSNLFTTHSGEQLMPSWSSRRLSGFISPHRYASARSPYCEGRSLGTPENAEIFRVNRLNTLPKRISRSQELYPRRAREGSGPNSPIVEKTVYVDTVNFVKTKNRVNSTPGTPSRIRRVETKDPPRKSYSIQDMTLLRLEVNTKEGESDDPKLDQERKSLERIKTISDKVGTGGSELSPIPPPLPKTPSESWLWRNLPSVTPRNSFSNSYVNSRFNPIEQENSKALSHSTKWETIVKTSYSHHDHIRYSEELAHPSRRSKT